MQICWILKILIYFPYQYFNLVFFRSNYVYNIFLHLLNFILVVIIFIFRGIFRKYLIFQFFFLILYFYQWIIAGMPLKIVFQLTFFRNFKKSYLLSILIKFSYLFAQIPLIQPTLNLCGYGTTWFDQIVKNVFKLQHNC